jgi:YD repeat-containing protein
MRLLSNLVSNAIKYTREGRVVVALRRDGAGHRVEVHDTGSGVERRQAFEQALGQKRDGSSATVDAADGSGAGAGTGQAHRRYAQQWRLTACA